jgi:hypothetical protein
VLVLAPRSLDVVDRLPLNGRPIGLGISADGQRLIVGVRDRLLVLDLQTGSGLGEMMATGLQRIQLVASP